MIAILSTLVCSLAIFRTTDLLARDQQVAALAVLWFNVTLGAAAGLLIVTPDAPSMLFWTLAIWTAAELLRSGNGWWWIGFGVFAGLGLSSKYTAAFLGAGIVLWIFWYRENRRWLRSWHLYAGGGVAALIFAPVLWWNVENGMASLAFQLGRSAQGFDDGFAGLHYVLEFIGSQIALLWPGLFLMAAGGMALFFRKRGEGSDPAYGLLVLTALPALLYFLYHATHSRVQGNWPLPLYGQLAVLGAWTATISYQAAGWFGAIARLTRRTQTPFGLVIILIAYAHAAFGLVTLPVRDPSREMHGWDDALSEIRRIAEEHSAHTVFAPDYGMTGWLTVYNRYGGQGLTVLPAGDRHRYGFMAPPDASEIHWPGLLIVRRKLSTPVVAEFGAASGRTVRFCKASPRRPEWRPRRPVGHLSGGTPANRALGRAAR